MELSLAGLVGAVIGAVLGAVNYAIIVSMVESKLRAAGARTEQGPEELERRISAARRSILAFDMLLFHWRGILGRQRDWRLGARNWR